MGIFYRSLAKAFASTYTLADLCTEFIISSALSPAKRGPSASGERVPVQPVRGSTAQQARQCGRGPGLRDWCGGAPCRP